MGCFALSSRLVYRATESTTLLASIQVAATPSQIILDEQLELDEGLEPGLLVNPDGLTRLICLDVTGPSEPTLEYRARVRTTPRLFSIDEVEPLPISALPPEVVGYLYPSRYCPSDEFGRFAETEFGGFDHPLAQVEAIEEWIHDRIEYQANVSTPTTSATGSLVQRAGVCRDFAHLGICLCRALSIPARYISCYGFGVEPPDFHACFEAWVGGRWFAFDATRLTTPDALVCIGTGRDAADNSVATIFGQMELLEQQVECRAEEFELLYPGPGRGSFICLEGAG